MTTYPYSDVDCRVFDWLTELRRYKIPVSGTEVREMSNICARKLGYTDFKDSDVWLMDFKRRYGLYGTKDCRKRPSEDTRKDSSRIGNQCAPPRRTTTAVDNENVLSKTVENNGEDGTARTIITAIPIERVKDALKTLRRFFETTAAAGTDGDGAFSALSNLEHIVEDRINNDKQTLITDFFKKKTTR